MAGSGGAWKVAYADFVTAMMAFFLVMWLVGQDKPVKDAIAQYFRDPFSVPSDRPSSNGPGPTFMPHEATNPAPPMGDGGDKKGGSGEGTQKRGPQTVIKRPSGSYMFRDGSRTSMGTHLPFGGDGADLDAAGKKNLDELLPDLAGKRNLVEIRANVSQRPLDPGTTFDDRWQLAYARCAATREYLIAHGVAPERIRMSQAGGFSPSAGEAAQDPASQDARVEVYMLDEFAGGPEGAAGAAAPGASPWNVPDPQGAAAPDHGAEHPEAVPAHAEPHETAH
jgi:chemotaxis protein MotB